MTCSQDIVSQLIEEIALEGLEGITLQALWLRLDDRPDFGFKPLSDKIKKYIWNTLTGISCLDFFALPKPRKKLKIFDKISTFDGLGNNILPPDYEDIYPHCPVNDEVTGLMGSAKDFATRVKVTKEVVNLSLDECSNKWGMKLVIVASQEVRRTTLCGYHVNPSWEFSVNEYCLLERVGRSRWQGEITHGQYGLKLLHDDNKMLFYYRKCLVKRNLITTQTFILRLKNNNVSGKLIHLKHFSVVVKSKSQFDSELVIDYIKATPERMIPYADIQKLGLKSNLKKLLKKMSKNILAELVPYRQMFPDAPTSAWKCKDSPIEKNIRVIKLISEERDDEEEEEQEDEDNSTGVLDENNRWVGVPLIRQAYLALERSHIAGMTQSDLAKHLGLSHLTARAICKQLKRYKLCSSTLKDMGRQRVSVFYCNKFDTLKASIPSAVANEKSKLLKILQDEVLSARVKEMPEPEPEPVKKRASAMRPGTTSKVIKVMHGTPTPSTRNPSARTTKITLKKSEDDNIKTEIVVMKPDSNRTGKVSGLLDGADDSSNLSLRLLKRANLILKAVNTMKIIQDPQKLQRMINEEEEQEGFNYTVDRKSVLRIVEKLELEGHLQRIRVTLSGMNKEKTFTFICHPSISPQNSEIQSVIDQAKMKLPIITKPPKGSPAGSNPRSLLSIKELQYDHRIGRTQYGFKPKFIRLRNMHFYLYYMIYNYTGSAHISLVTKRNILNSNNLETSLFKEMSQVYLDKLDWKMFIPPLPVHKDYKEGWCLVSDILLRLPVFMFLSLVNIPYRIPSIMDYLEHPLRKFYLVKDLPPEIGHHLTIMRKYIFTIFEILQQLAFIGLVQFGPQMMKEKDQVYVYLNRNAKLVDTTSSDEGYNHISIDKKYEENTYHFASTDDLERYWSDLVKYAMNTKLGSKACVAGKEVVVESVGTKKQMLDALRPKSSEEALAHDTGYQPGDGLGAAGIDSDLFVHLKRNWYWSSMQSDKQKAVSKKAEKSNSDSSNKKSSAKAEKGKKINSSSTEKQKNDNNSKDLSIEEKDNLHTKASKSGLCKPETRRITTQKTPIHVKPFMRKRHKKVTRYFLPYAKKRLRKPYYDQQDREALKRMKKLRVDWSTKEDNVLLLCKVASIFMCPYSLRQKMKNFSSIRDILHKNLPDCSLNKTSRACQRRIQYMMKNPHTAHSVDICTEELHLQKELVAKYGHSTMFRLLNKYKDQEKSYEEFGKEYDVYFLELVEILMNRLKSVTFNKSVLENEIIPDSLEEFYKKFTLAIPCPRKRMGKELYKELESDSDIMGNVVKYIIHSSLACIADKTCYSYQMLHIYQQYPDKLLRSVMTEIRAAGVVSIKKFQKVLKRKNSGDKVLPEVSTAPYKLSNAYMNKLQTKFQHFIYSDSYYYFSNIISEIDNCSSDLILNVSLNNGGECAWVIELFSLGLIQTNIEFPEQVIILDPKLSETEETFSKLLKRFNELLKDIKSKNNESNKGNETDYEDVDDNKIECDYEEFNYSNKNCLASAASRLALFSLRDDTSDSSDTNVQHAHDYFVINPCKVSVTVKLEAADSLQSLFTDYQEKMDALSNLRKLSVLPEGMKALSDKEEAKNRSHVALELLSYIKEGRELGVTTFDLLENFGPKIVNDLKALIEQHLVLLVGVVALRLVHYRFCKPWLVASYCLPRSIKDSLMTGQERAKDLEELKEESMRNSTEDKQKQNEPGTSSDNQASKKIKYSEEPGTSVKKEPGTNVEEEPGKSVEDSELEPVVSLNDQRSGDVEDPEKESSIKKRRLSEGEGNSVTSQLRKKIKPASTAEQKSSTFTRVKESKSLKDIEVVIKPWIRVDGSLNRRVLDRFLGSVLSHTINFPGISLEKLQARFLPALSPSQTHEILLLLKDLGCVSLKIVVNKSNLSLFSKRRDVKVVSATGLEAAKDVILEPDPLAVTKLGLFIGDKAYSIAYMDPTNLPS